MEVKTLELAPLPAAYRQIPRLPRPLALLSLLIAVLEPEEIFEQTVWVINLSLKPVENAAPLIVTTTLLLEFYAMEPPLPLIRTPYLLGRPTVKLRVLLPA